MGAEKRGRLTSSGEVIKFQGRERRITHLKLGKSRYASSEVRKPRVFVGWEL